MATIDVERLRETTYRVIVSEKGSRTVHEVTVTSEHVTHYAPDATPERLLRASFEFLLEREPKESILSRFELPIIERYFPNYPQQIQRMLG